MRACFEFFYIQSYLSPEMSSEPVDPLIKMSSTVS